MQETHYFVTSFLLIATFLILILGAFILFILFLYRKKQIAYFKDLETIKAEQEKTILNTQLEIQEQTFQNISREIHDHICLNLTLAKLNLITLDANNKPLYIDNINSSIEIIGKSIHELSNISHSMNPEIIESHGIITALELELGKLKKLQLFNIDFDISGNPVFLDSQKSLSFSGSYRKPLIIF